MPTVETTFKLTFTEDQLAKAREYVEEMKKHPKRVYWQGNQNKSEEELIYSHIAHRILSGFYNTYDFQSGSQIVDMKNKSLNS